MCDSFLAISAEQLTKAVNLAAAGTLSALNGAGEDHSEQGIARERKIDNDPVKKGNPLFNKSSPQVVPGSPKILREDIPASRSYYGRARKVSAKKKMAEETPITQNGKKYSSRKNYKLSPPLIPTGIRNIGAQVLLNPQVVKVSHAISNPISPASKGVVNTHSVRPITLIHSPQLSQNLPKNSNEPNCLLSSILQSPPRNMSIQPPDLFLHKSPTGTVAKKTVVTTQAHQLTGVTSPTKDNPKSPQLIPPTKPDSVFRVPFPVSHTQSASHSSFQIVRLPSATNINPNNFNVLNLGSPNSPVSPIISSNQTGCNQMVPKATAISTSFVSQSLIDSKISPPTSISISLPSSSQVVTSCIVSPKCFTVFQPPSTTATKQNVNSSEKTGSLGAKSSQVISLPHPVNLSSLTQQLIPPVEKSNLSPSSPSSVTTTLPSVAKHGTSRYVTIRPNVVLPKDCKLSTIMSPSTPVRPIMIVSSSNNVNAPSSPAKVSSSHSANVITNKNPGIIFLPSVVNSVPLIQNTTQSPVPASKLQPQVDIKSPIKTVVNDANILTKSPGNNEQRPTLMSPNIPAVLPSPSAISIGSPLSSAIHLSCHDSSHKLRTANVGHPVQSVTSYMATSLPTSSPMPSSSHGASTHCVSGLNPATLSVLTSSKDKLTQPPISPTMSAVNGSIVPRMPLTVVKDPFSSKPPQSKGTVRLTVYPLPPGFNLASTTSNTTMIQSQAASLPSSGTTNIAPKSVKDREGLSQASSKSLQMSTCNSNPVLTSVSSSTVSSIPFPAITSAAVSSNSSGKQAPCESLQSPDTKGRKLVISPDGINQLQSLLRKMGTKEGYFIISTPRSAPSGSGEKPLSLNLGGLSGSPVVTINASLQSQSVVTPTTSSNMKHTNVLATAISTCASPVICESINIPLQDVKSSVGDSMKHDHSIASNDKVLDGNEDSENEMSSLNQAEAMRDIESEAVGNEEESDDNDDDTSMSGDSTCSSNALVIETNDHFTDSLSSPTPVKDLEDGNKAMSSPPKTSSIPLSKESEPIPVQDKLPSMDMTLDSNITSPLSLSEIVRQHQSRYGLEYQPLYSPPFSSCKDAAMSVSEVTHEEKIDKDDHNALSNAENSEIRFPIPESPLGISSLLRHHQQQQSNQHHHHSLHQHQSQSDNQQIYEQSLNTPHALYMHHDQINDIHMHNSSDIEAAINLQRLSECPGPPPPPSSSSHPVLNSINASSQSSTIASPKSPLSINSSHPVEPHTPLHPPMTPNTMLINLLNRVPTPLLTNHQDLLSVPSSQENDIHFQASNQPLDPESSNNKDLHSVKSAASNLQENLVNTSKDPSCHGLFNTPSHPHTLLSQDSGSFEHTQPQNALDLIASNYLPSHRKDISNGLNDQISAFPNSVVSTHNFTLFSTSWHQSNNSTMTFSSPEFHPDQFNVSVNSHPCDVDRSIDKADHSNHCKTCCLPITITVNLDAGSPPVSNSNESSTESHQIISEPHHELEGAFNDDQHHEMSQQQCVLFDNFGAAINPVQEKCRDAEIIRHLIMNTGSKNPTPFLAGTPSMPPFEAMNQPLQNCHFEQQTQNSFITTGEPSNDLDSSVSESEPQFAPPSYQPRMSMQENIPQENCHENFNNMTNSASLIYDNNSSYENVVPMEVNERIEDCSFNINNSAASEAPFSTSTNSVFDASQNPIFINAQNSTNPSFIMHSSLSDIHSSFNTESIQNKEQMPPHSSQISQDGKHNRSTEFPSNIEQNELFFNQSSTAESHSNSLHLYDMNTLHDSSHEMGYPLPSIENHDNQIQPHQECLQSSHCSDMQPGLLNNQLTIQGGNKQLQDHPFDFRIQQSHQYPNESVNQSGSDASVVTFSDNQSNLNGYINETYPSHFYPNSAGSNIPMFSQQCPVGSEAPLMESNNLTLNCSQLPSYKNSNASDIQMEFHYQSQDDSTTVGDKQLVLPSASFSPPSVADPAATPEPGAMEMYNGSFQNMSAYETYLRGGQSESRAQLGEPSPETGKFCVECNMMYKNQCKFHPCECNDISDAPILSHACLTLPPCLKLAPSDVAGHTNKTGVFAKETIAVRTKFGPLVGSPVSCDQLGSTRSFSLWQTFIGSNVKVIDTSDENSSNWLMFVKPACVSSEQNLVAFQHGNKVYFVTRTEVKEGQELRYWFSKDYARMLGIASKPKYSQHQLCPHCPVCKHVFADRKQVRSHIRLQHPKPQTNKCSHCSKRFSQVSHLNAHVLAVHLNVKKFVCHHCNKRFGDSSNLRKHIKSHSDERNFKCQICSKAFRQKAHLQVHMNSHMPVKHEQCRYCGSRFTRAFERKQHELQHTKQNRIECQHCGKVFYKQKIFKEHMKIHNNERNFPCNHCGKAFRNKFALTRHGPTCKQRKRGLSLIPANNTTNDILSRHLGAANSSSSSSRVGSSTNNSNTNDFVTKTNTDDEDLSMASSSVSSSVLSNDV